MKGCLIFGLVMGFLFFSSQAHSSQYIKIDASNPVYAVSDNIRRTDFHSGVDLRAAAASIALNIYMGSLWNAVFNKVKKGDAIEMTYTDGSKEVYIVECLMGSLCAVPLPGTQMPPPGGIFGSGGDGGTGGGGGFEPPVSNWGDEPSTCGRGPCSGTVTVGG